MAEPKKVITLDSSECKEMVEYLMEARNRRVEDGKPTDRVCDLMLKIIDAPPAKNARKAEREAR